MRTVAISVVFLLLFLGLSINSFYDVGSLNKRGVVDLEGPIQINNILNSSNEPDLADTATANNEVVQLVKKKDLARAKLNDFSTHIPLHLYNEKIGKKILNDKSDFHDVYLSQKELDMLAPHLGLIVSNAAPALAYRDGVLAGIEIRNIAQGDVLDQFGFQPGDIVSFVNDIKIYDPFEVVQLLKNLNHNRVTVTIERAGIQQELDFILPP